MPYSRGNSSKGSPSPVSRGDEELPPASVFPVKRQDFEDSRALEGRAPSGCGGSLFAARSSVYRSLGRAPKEQSRAGRRVGAVSGEERRALPGTGQGLCRKGGGGLIGESPGLRQKGPAFRQGLETGRLPEHVRTGAARAVLFILRRLSSCLSCGKKVRAALRLSFHPRIS